MLPGHQHLIHTVSLIIHCAPGPSMSYTQPYNTLYTRAIYVLYTAFRYTVHPDHLRPIHSLIIHCAPGPSTTYTQLIIHCTPGPSTSYSTPYITMYIRAIYALHTALLYTVHPGFLRHIHNNYRLSSFYHDVFKRGNFGKRNDHFSSLCCLLCYC